MLLRSTKAQMSVLHLWCPTVCGAAHTATPFRQDLEGRKVKG